MIRILEEIQPMRLPSSFRSTIRTLAICLCPVLLFGNVEAQCTKSAAEVYTEASASVVRVLAAKVDPFRVVGRFSYQVGSGLIYDEVGIIITNAHVVHDAVEIAVSVNDGLTLEAALIGTDPISDLAVIRIAGDSPPLKKARLADIETLQIGSPVVAIGFPLGIGKTITRGVLSGMERLIRFTPMSWLTPLIQTDAAISPGNSGGPLLNMCAEVIGINTLAGVDGQNINFAIPADAVQKLVPQLMEHGRVIRPWHGVYGQPVPPILTMTMGIPPGLIVETVEPGSPAEKIGLQGGRFRIIIGTDEYVLGGDIIVSVNDTKLRDRDTVVKVVQSMKVGDKITLNYLRDGLIQSAEVVLPERPSLPGDARRFYQGANR